MKFENIQRVRSLRKKIISLCKARYVSTYNLDQINMLMKQVKDIDTVEHDIMCNNYMIKPSLKASKYI